MITHPGPPASEDRNQPAAKRRKTDMKVPVVDTSSALGVIDPESDIEGKIAPSSVQDVKMEEEDSKDNNVEEEEYVPKATDAATKEEEEEGKKEDTGDEEPVTKVTDATVDDKEEEEEEEEKKKSRKQREFILTVTADVLGRATDDNDDITIEFGYTSLRECLQEEETSFCRACGEIVPLYIIDNAKECFETITNLGAFDGQDKVELNGPVRVDRDTGMVSFPFREVVPLDKEDSEELWGNMLCEIENGSDTWACGSFGDIWSDDVNSKDWDYWLGNGRRCRDDLPLDEGFVKIGMYLGVNPDIVEKV